MGILIYLAMLGSVVWVAIDSSRLGYDKRDLTGVAAMGPVGWTLCVLMMWIVGFPMYLVKRPYLKAMGQWRRQVGPAAPPAPLFVYPPPGAGYPPPGAGYPPPAAR
ncbi:MAG: hypothetical protein JNK64_11025 [Myxococcales bacterium]|nr:hypothetical protein [Myxococcales bacterium]